MVFNKNIMMWMEHGIDDTCGSLRFDLSTPQTIVGYLDGLHMSLGDRVKVVNVWKCLDPKYLLSVLHWSNDTGTWEDETFSVFALILFLPSSVTINLIWQPQKISYIPLSNVNFFVIY